VSDAFLILQPSKSGEAKPYQIKQFLGLVEEYNLRMEGIDPEDGEDDDE
jgi:hypothetical protein